MQRPPLPTPHIMTRPPTHQLTTTPKTLTKNMLHFFLISLCNNMAIFYYNFFFATSIFLLQKKQLIRFYFLVVVSLCVYYTRHIHTNFAIIVSIQYSTILYLHPNHNTMHEYKICMTKKPRGKEKCLCMKTLFWFVALAVLLLLLSEFFFWYFFREAHISHHI